MKKNPHAVAMGKKGGKSTSEAKKKAAQENGKKGGRPPSNLTEKCIYCSKPRDEMFSGNVCHICDAF